MPGPADQAGPDPTDPMGPTTDLTPGQHADIQDLLAGLRHTDPTPADVTARLDAALSAEAQPAVGQAHPRRGRRLVLAAASVAVVAAVATPFVRHASHTSSPSSAPTAAGQAVEPSPSLTSGASPRSTQRSAGTDAPVELHSTSFAADVEQDYAVLDGSGAYGTAAPACVAPTPSDALLLSRTVLLDGAPARLDVTEGPLGSGRAVAYSCDGATVLSRAKVDLPTDPTASPQPAP